MISVVVRRAMLRGISCAIIAVVGAPSGVAAQSPLPDLSQEWRWVDFGPDSGLPSGRVFQLVEVDSRIWIRTEEGIAFYDGFMWHPVGSSEGLAEPGSNLAREQRPGWCARGGRRSGLHRRVLWNGGASSPWT